MSRPDHRTATSVTVAAADPENVPVPFDRSRRTPWRGARIWTLAAVAVVIGLVVALLPSLLPSAKGERASAASVVHPAAARSVIDDPAAHTLVLLPRTSRGRLALFLHGFGGDEHSLLVPKRERVAEALLADGYTVGAALAGGNAWGDAATVRDYGTFARSLMRRYDLHSVYLIAESMGGLAGMQLAGRLPQTKALAGIYPVCDLRTMTHHSRRFTTAIEAAWRGRSARAVSPVTPAGVPMRVWASAADTVVARATNGAACVWRARAAGTDAVLIPTVREHGDPSNFRPAAVVAFFDAH
jgi:pimeloyl-ACP methyl ester carboxylesterase